MSYFGPVPAVGIMQSITTTYCRRPHKNTHFAGTLDRLPSIIWVQGL